MKRLFAWLVISFMAVAMLQIPFNSAVNITKANEELNKAVMIAVRFVPVRYNRDGQKLEGKLFPWQRSGETVWGREGYGMPNSLLAIENENNIPALLPNTQAEPLFWAKFYLEVISDGGKSRFKDPWYAVYDSCGQIWLDPDGYFNDCRYFEPADPANLNGKYQTNLCTNNPNALVDPSTGNNTQGPYILDPDNPRFDMFHGPTFIDKDGNTCIYFWDRNNTKRFFRMGWIDMVDFPLERGEGSVPPIRPSVVQGETFVSTQYSGTYDWDAQQAYDLLEFRYWGLPRDAGYEFDDTPITQPDYTLEPNKSFRWYYNSDIDNPQSKRVLCGDELHTDNVSDEAQNKTASITVNYPPYSDPPSLHRFYTQISDFDPGEHIYRKGTNATLWPDLSFFVQEGDYRLTPVSVYFNGETRNYPPNSKVLPGDWDCAFDGLGNPVNQGVPPRYKSLFRFRTNFAEYNADEGTNGGERIRKEDDELHVDNKQTPADSKWHEDWYSYEYQEWIYRDHGTDPQTYGRVTVGDYRLTNVNGPVFGGLKKDRNRGLLSSDVQLIVSKALKETSNPYVPRVRGDALLLAEVIFGGGNDSLYNLSIESDIWQGEIPDFTAASLRSQSGSFLSTAQSMQRNTVLDDDGRTFDISATTFQDIDVKFREYLGVEIWKDDGIDNNLGENFMDNPPPPIDTLFPYNLSDDYRPGRTGEEFLGSSNNVVADKDYGRVLSPFPFDIMYHDTTALDASDPINNPYSYGCGESIYKNKVIQPGALQIVDPGDERITEVTVTVGQNVITYPANTTVVDGDSDVGLTLFNFNYNEMFFDQDWLEKDIKKNYTYDNGEGIYLTESKVPRDAPLFTTISSTDIDNYFFWGEAPFESILYFDHDWDPVVNPVHTITPGDIRVLDLSGQFDPGSIVSANMLIDMDLYYDMDPTPAYIRVYQDPIFPSSHVGGYVDVDNSGTISMGDIRLYPIFGYQPYTVVEIGDRDNSDDPLNELLLTIEDIIWYGYIQQNQLLLSIQDILPFSAIRITPLEIDQFHSTRLTTITLDSSMYECGSLVGGNKNYWINENIVHGLSVGKNCDFRFIDWEVFPSNRLGMELSIEPEIKVEQTTQIRVTINPSPKPEYWENGVYHPAEKVYVYIINNQEFLGIDFNEDYRVITSDNPEAVFEFTPYQGSCTPTGFYKGWQKVWNSEKFRYELVTFDNNVKIIAVKDCGGVVDPTPGHYKIYDPFWKMHDNTMRYAGKTDGSKIWGPTEFPVPPLPAELKGRFDTYTEVSKQVLPEDINLLPSKKCLSILDQKFPNLSVKLRDADNPNDVNDPSGQTISVPSGHEIVAFYNASGAGIQFMFTGRISASLAGKVYGLHSIGATEYDIEENQLIIGQYNDDETLLVWMWNDCGPNPGILDEGDFLWAPNPFYDPDDPSTGPNILPGYLKVNINGNERIKFTDTDCSQGKDNCISCGDGLFDDLGTVTYGDTFGPLEPGIPPYITVATYGVPSLLRNYGQDPYPSTNEGGEIPVTVLPRNALTKLALKVETYNVIFDYNSSIKHPPYFIETNKDHSIGGFDDEVYLDWERPGSGLQRFNRFGTDYCGVHYFKVLAPDPYVNFVDFNTIDHALQNSQVDYTAGENPLSPMPVPTPQIQAPYNPMVIDVAKDLRAYPGGQTHTGRVAGAVKNGGYYRSDDHHSGWNAYPAIWWWYWYDEGIDYNKFVDFNKLGTEFFPLTDYGTFFILKDIDGNHLSFTKDTQPDYRIRKIELSGPIARPKIFDPVKQTIESEYRYNNLRHVPIVYDWENSIVIDSSNFEEYEMSWDNKYYGRREDYPLAANGTYSNREVFDWTRTKSDGKLYQYENPLLLGGGQLDFRGLNNIFRIDEFIPISNGLIQIKVTLYDGTIKVYQDCCAEPPTDGIEVHALTVESNVEALYADQDNKIEVTVTEYTAFQEESLVNDALVYVWQDRGVVGDVPGFYEGAGDGWLGNPPHSSKYTELAPQYLEEEDYNKDGKISFKDYETEIIGSYDLATNTWNGGLIDGRTFQRGDGVYSFTMSQENGCQIDTVGIDFGGLNNEPDHLISDYEKLPVMVTAYKYGDDNTDRSFEPLYNYGGTTPQFSHEVYIAGQKFLPVEPIMDLTASVQPSPLTAGVTPELVDPVSPLSFVLTDDEGVPVDLSVGIPDRDGKYEIDNEDIWNFLFRDIHPDPLPDYYWLRTDLHNNDGTRVNNHQLYSISSSAPFSPIDIDFNLKTDGKYSFRGFCANDEGSFDVIIYTPDRKRAAKVNVKVVLPTVEYEVTNTDDPAGTSYSVPGNPDFVLTAADNRIYKVTITAKNAQGLLLKGVSKGVSTCGGGIKNTARFTPYSTRPESYDFNERDRNLFAEHFMQDLYSYTIHFGFDFNDNQKIDTRNSELCLPGTFYQLPKPGADQQEIGKVYYNTTLVRYDEESIHGGWDVTPNPNLTPPTVGWGLGAIYNSPHKGGYLFADIDPNQKLDFHDSLGLDVNAQTTFYVFAEDVCYVGGLVGDNVYTNNPAQADLCGYPPVYKTDPAHVESRFVPNQTPDGVFYLDWEAFPSHEVHIAPPRLSVLSAETRIELGQDLLNAANYDLTYAIENNMIVQVRPADPRDLPMHEDGRVFLFGNQHQTAIYGDTSPSATDPAVMETTLFFTPTGIGEQIASLGYFNKNWNYHVEPYHFDNTSTYTLRDLIHFDSIVGLQVEVDSIPSLNPHVSSELTISVSEIGTNAPVNGAKVTIQGPGINTSGTTNDQGLYETTVTPNEKGIVTVHVTNADMMEGHTELWVKPDTAEPTLELDPVVSITNNTTLQVTGITNPGNEVKVNNEAATVAQNGSFSVRVTLEEGLNTIIATATTPTGKTVRRMLTITLDTTPPMIFVDDPGTLQGSEPFVVTLTGRVEPDSQVTVNNQTATVTHDIWSIDVTVKPGKNAFVITATDVAGNVNTMNFEVIVEENEEQTSNQYHCSSNAWYMEVL